MADSIFEAYNKCKKELLELGIEDCVFEAKQIIKHITGYSNAQILSHYNDKLTQFEQNNLIAIMKQRRIRYPLQYIIGKWSFFGREFSVGPGVLIPRADTELLVETALELIKGADKPEIIDLCAGTGCIGISLGLERADATVTLVEKYPEAARYSAKNISDNKAYNVTLLNGDVTLGDSNDKSYDLIVSNPPYITDNDMKKLQPEVEFEPETALNGGEDGCDFYRIIIEKYLPALKKGGHIVFEVGVGEAETVAELLRSAGLCDVQLRRDYGEIDRVVFGTLK